MEGQGVLLSAPITWRQLPICRSRCCSAWPLVPHWAGGGPTRSLPFALYLGWVEERLEGKTRVMTEEHRRRCFARGPLAMAHARPFSCKGLGFCPSCLGRRMAETSANLVEHVLPERAPLRQFVLTLPFDLRARRAYDGTLLGAVCHAFVDSVLGDVRRALKWPPTRADVHPQGQRQPPAAALPRRNRATDPPPSFVVPPGCHHLVHRPRTGSLPGRSKGARLSYARIAELRRVVPSRWWRCRSSSLASSLRRRVWPRRHRPPVHP